MVLESARSFSLNVSRAASTTTRNVWKPASVGLTSNVTRVIPASSLTGCVATCGAVGEQADRRRLGDRRADLRHGLDRLAEPCRRRRREALDEHLVGVAEADLARLDLDAPARGQRGLGLAGPGRVVAVAEQHDPLLGVVGEERRRQAQGRPDVGGGLDRRRRDAVDLLELGRQPLDEGVLAERDDARDVARRLLLEGLAQERERVRAARVADRVRQVDDEDRREPIDRQDQLEPGEGEHQGGQDHRAQDQGGTTATGPHPPARRRVQPDRQDEGRDQEEQRERRLERDAHQVVPPGGAAEPGDQRSPHPDHGVAVVDRPLDAQADQDEQDDREPQLVAGRRAVRRGAVPGRAGRIRGRSEALDGRHGPRRDLRLTDVEEVDREADRRVRVDRDARMPPATRTAPRMAAARARRRVRTRPPLADGFGDASAERIGVTV